MPRLLLSAALSCASACSLLVSFEDLHFEAVGASGSGGGGATGGAPSSGGAGADACGSPPGMGGAVGMLSRGGAKVTEAGADFDAAAAAGLAVYVAGRDAGGSPIVIKLDSTLAEESRITGSGLGRVTALAASGPDVFFAGVASQAQNLAGPCAAGLETGPFVAAWHANLTCTLFHEFGGTNGRLRAALAVNSAVVVAGHGESAVLQCRTPVMGLQHFIGRYLPGDCQWASAFLLGTEDEGIYAIANASDGRLVVAGSYQGDSAAVAECALPPALGVDGFVALLEADGKCVGAEVLSSAGKEVATALAVDGTDIYVAGTYEGSPDFVGCGEPLPDAGFVGGSFVAKLNGAGRRPQMLWARGFATSGGVAPGALAVSAGDDLTLAGSFIGDANFGGGDLDNSTGAARIFVAELDPATGAHHLSARAVTYETDPNPDEDDLVSAMVLTLQRRMVLAGSYQGDTPLTGGLQTERVGYIVDTDLQP